MRRVLVVHANWDPEASVWVARSDDVPGLVTEALTPEELISKLKVMIPDLLEANGDGYPGEEIPFELLAKVKATAHRRIA